jgi:hypothetical protein
VSAQVLTYQQNSDCDKHHCQARRQSAGNLEEWCQVIDSSDFFGAARNLSDAAPGTVNQAFGGASDTFPTKLSTDSVGDFKMSYGS